MRATFRRMSDSTEEDWSAIAVAQKRFMAQQAERILQHLHLLAHDYGGFPVSRLQHCLQTAQSALDAGEDEEYVVCALLHDIGDTLGSTNHADVSAAILQPYVSEANHWMIKHHAIFQGYHFFHHLGMDRNMRDRYKDHPHYERTLKFVEQYDNHAFDAEASELSLSPFKPMVRNVFSSPKQSLYKTALEQ